MLRLLTTAALALALASASPPSHADETTHIDLPRVEPVTVSYRAFDPERVLVDENSLVRSIASVLTDSTRFRMRVGEPDTKDSVYDTGGRAKVDTQKHRLYIEYVALTRFLSGGATGTTMTIPVSYEITRTDTLVTITFTFPDHAASVRHGMPFLTRKLWAMDSILEDYASLAQRMASIDVQMNYRASGELESKYKAEAVLGNLERLLGRSGYPNSPGAQIGSSGAITRDADYIYTDHGPPMIECW